VFMRRNIFNITLNFIIVALLLSQTGCLNYYKAMKSVPAKEPDQIVELRGNGRYFILRNGNTSLSMSDILLSTDKKTLQCRLDTLPKYHQLHLKHGHRNGNFQYKIKAEKFVLNEVHLYIPNDTLAKPGSTYTLALDKVQKMETIKKDAGRTTGSYALGFVFFGISVIAAGLVIFALSGGINFQD
jgi:hypothetical protein